MRFFDDDRLHYNALGHHEVARMALRALNVPNDLEAMQPEPFPLRTWREARSEDLGWAREHLVPWVLRRLRQPVVGRQPRGEAPRPLAGVPSRAGLSASGLHRPERDRSR